MTFEEILDQAIAMLQRRGRVTYQTLRLQFQLDEEHLEALKDAILFACPQVVDAAGRGLVWSGEAGAISPPTSVSPQSVGPPVTLAPHVGTTAVAPPEPQPPDAERRQLTVLFCDLLDSTVLASQLDPEEWREVVRAYQEACAKVIARFEGHIAQYLGDGLLVYFGYPLAHEDDAQRAVRAGLGMIEALGQLSIRLTRERGVHLAVRLGIHTGLVVVGEVGGGTRQEQLALGETPNLAARLQGIAAPNTLVVSAATMQLLGGFFTAQSLGASLLKGLAQPVEVYQVLHESTARSRLEAAGSTGLTPLVGREQEVALLLERWAQVKDGLGQVVLLSGEAGIGKSRLVQVLKEQVATEPQAWLTPCQCSPYHQNTALYPLIDLLERVVLRFDREESPQQKLRKLEGHLVQYGFPLAESVPLHASLLSIPLTADYAPLPMSPEQQKQKTLQALLTTLLRIAAQQPVLFVMEDLHWVDPSTLEFLSLLVDQGPTARILALLTFRPDFSPPWTGRSHLTQVTLPRLPRRQAAEMAGRVAHSKTLPAEVMEQVVAKTDGVPLFVEELTKMVLESGLLQEREERYELTGPLPPLAIPTTLHDSLMARLDRLATVKALAQLGATLGREFSYALLQAVSPWDEGTLRRGLHQLVEAEFLYQQGLPPEATYRFKHALIQETAYQSLLKSTRQQHHQRIAQIMEVQFPEIGAAQPELLAHHYTEAGLTEPAIRYWHRAGEQAAQRSAHAEAVDHLTKALARLMTLPDTPGRAQQELTLQLSLGASLMVTKGYSAPEVERIYTRQQELCLQVGEPFQVAQVLFGLFAYHAVRGHFTASLALGEQFLPFAQRQQDATVSFMVHTVLGGTLRWLGELSPAQAHLEQALAFYDRERHRDLTYHIGQDTGLCALTYAAETLWCRGYPDQALERIHHALSLAQTLSHPFSLADTLGHVALVHMLRHEDQEAQAHVEVLLPLAHEHGFAWWVGIGTSLQGWALIERAALSGAREQQEAGLGQRGEGLASLRGMEAEIYVPLLLGAVAQGYGQGGQANEGLRVVAEALALVEKNTERWNEAELYRLKGELMLAHESKSLQAKGTSQNTETPHPHSHIPEPESEAEACFVKAMEIAQKQQAKSLELRSATSLARLWQQQGKRQAAHDLLAPIYHWFTEGFDTADLQDARALLAELAR